ncbi:Aste57867_17517 [Aphanomyces stellatus]|uniref:Aste57867_17517 protein n=1 Tax=Aphanomyces stellatus TaxID=120398 RepID=A0A485L868_9STRA|nr:hypothetical protein As57867_017457 [Aphanomyces stellatus]VFT94270.1 Aste57867_17517 [Aphanomyces stellatus]
MSNCPLPTTTTSVLSFPNVHFRSQPIDDTHCLHLHATTDGDVLVKICLEHKNVQWEWILHEAASDVVTWTAYVLQSARVVSNFKLALSTDQANTYGLDLDTTALDDSGVIQLILTNNATAGFAVARSFDLNPIAQVPSTVEPQVMLEPTSEVVVETKEKAKVVPKSQPQPHPTTNWNVPAHVDPNHVWDQFQDVRSALRGNGLFRGYFYRENM